MINSNKIQRIILDEDDDMNKLSDIDLLEDNIGERLIRGAAFFSSGFCPGQTKRKIGFWYVNESMELLPAAIVLTMSRGLFRRRKEYGILKFNKTKIEFIRRNKIVKFYCDKKYIGYVSCHGILLTDDKIFNNSGEFLFKLNLPSSCPSGGQRWDCVGKLLHKDGRSTLFTLEPKLGEITTSEVENTINALGEVSLTKLIKRKFGSTFGYVPSPHRTPLFSGGANLNGYPKDIKLLALSASIWAYTLY